MNLTCECGKLLRVPDDFAGRQGQCPGCGHLLGIPPRTEESPAPPWSPHEVPQQFALRVEPPPPPTPGTAESRLPPEPPAVEPEFVRPAYKLFSPSHIGMAAFFGGPVGAFHLLAVNFA